MNSYSIKDIELLTGIKAHTIRIWEKRYGVLEPNRSDTNIRWYDDDQIRKVLNVSVLVHNGHKISKVAKMSPQEIYSALDELFDDSHNSNAYAHAAISRLIEASLNYDTIGFNRVFDDSIRRFGMIDGYKEVIYPLLVRIGLMWSKAEMLPAQEHFLSSIVKKKIFASINGLDENADAKETWTLFLPENEYHEIGLLFAYFVLKLHGKKVVYLGQNVPYENLRSVVESTDSDCVYFFALKKRDMAHLKNVIATLKSDFEAIRVYASGGEALSISEDVNLLNSVEDLLIAANEE